MRSRLVAALAVIALVVVPVALADGDPASDYLLEQTSFVSSYDNVPASTTKDLTALLASAKKQGFNLRVASICTRYDLGSVTVLFRDPTRYSKFLGEELYYYWRGELLVVMPNGYGLYKAKNLPAADKALVARLPKLHTTNCTSLVLAAEHVVRLLAARHGITLSDSSGSSGSSTTSDRLIIGGAVLVALLLALGGRFAWRRRRATG
jgi:hypothetical protein